MNAMRTEVQDVGPGLGAFQAGICENRVPALSASKELCDLEFHILWLPGI